jgi:two-component system, sensor histidine kinase and response regulator
MLINASDHKHSNILIVDDNTENLFVLEEMLSLLGHTVSMASDGATALQIAKSNPPELILLDINMPEMDGFEVCARLKQDEALSSIPVIFLSGRADTSGITSAFAAGGVDYVTKPFVVEELASRISTHLKLHFAQIELQQFASRLEELVIERTWDLSKAHERLKILDTTKNEFLDVIAHELRTPATSVIAVGQLAIMSMPNSAERSELMEIFEKGSLRLERTIDNALLLARLQTSESFVISEHLNIGSLLDDSVKNVEAVAVERHNQIIERGDCKCQVAGNHQLAEQCVTTILNLALKMANPHTSILVECQTDAEFAHLVFTASGSTFAAETLDGLFETFSYERISSQVEELSLSLPLSAQIAALFGGRLEMENTADPAGIRITLTLKKI